MMLPRIAACIALTLALPASAADQIKLTAPQIQNMGIQTQALQRAPTVYGKTMPAQVAIPPAQMRMVSAPQSGMLEQLTVAVGDRVSRGQALAHIQSPDLIALQRDFLQAAAQLRLAHTALNRDDSLLKDGVIAPRRQQETSSHYQELSAAVEERRQALQLAGMSRDDIKQLEQTRQLSAGLTVRSPIDGVVLETRAEAGQRVNVSDPIYRVATLNPLWLEIRAPLEQMAGLAVGARLQVRTPNVEGKVIAIGHNVDPASQTVLLRAEVTRGTEQLRPGQYVQATISTAGPQLRFQIPTNAVVRSGSRTVVFAAQAQGFQAVPVTVLSSESGRSIVTGNLQGNERVAVTGLAAIKGAWMGLGGGE